MYKTVCYFYHCLLLVIVVSYTVALSSHKHLVIDCSELFCCRYADRKDTHLHQVSTFIGKCFIFNLMLRMHCGCCFGHGDINSY